LSAHPLFPAVIALWFGSLFGLGSLAVRPVLLEALVLKYHFDVILPLAAPPLGIKARLLLASAMAIGGGMLGHAIGRAIARTMPETGKMHHARQTMFSSLAEHGQEGPQLPGLPITVNESPLHGGQPQILDVTEFDLAQDAAGEDFPPEQPLSEVLPQEPAPLAVCVSAPAGAEPGEPASVSERPAARPPEGMMSHADLIERLAFAMRRRHARMALARSSESVPAAAEPCETSACVTVVSGQADVDAGPDMPSRLAMVSVAQAVDSRQQDETARALRGALATLQRLNGAA